MLRAIFFSKCYFDYVKLKMGVKCVYVIVGNIKFYN